MIFFPKKVLLIFLCEPKTIFSFFFPFSPFSFLFLSICSLFPSFPFPFFPFSFPFFLPFSFFLLRLVINFPPPEQKTIHPWLSYKSLNHKIEFLPLYTFLGRDRNPFFGINSYRMCHMHFWQFVWITVGRSCDIDGGSLMAYNVSQNPCLII